MSLTILNLPWGWLIVRIIQEWTIGVMSVAHQELYQLDPSYHGVQQTPPVLTAEHMQLPGETNTQFAKRLTAFIREHQKRHELPKGARHHRQQDVKEYTEWFFRRRILKESLYRVARYDATNDPYPVEYDESNMQRYIRQAEKWLDAGGYFLDPRDEVEGER
jgi:hypothetical protein